MLDLKHNKQCVFKMKPYLLLLLLLTLLACNQDPTVTVKEETIPHSEKEEVKFTDILPEDLSDSLKINRINDLVAQIDLDSTPQVIMKASSQLISLSKLFGQYFKYQLN